MRLTTARYYTPSGRSIQAVGIEPDIKVQQSRVEPIGGVERERRSEASLRKALPNPNGTTVDKEKDKQQEIKAPTPAPAAAPAAPGAKPDAPATIKLGDPAQDYQLARALDLLRGLSLYRPPAAR